MNPRFAVICPVVGALTETFIRRHVDDLLPGETVVVTERRASPETWTFRGPELVLDRQAIGLGRRIRRIIGGWVRGPGAASDHVALQRFLSRHGVEAVLGEYLDWSLRWLEPIKRLGLRYYVHAHGYDVSRCLQSVRWREDYRRYRESDGVITMSAWSRDRLVSAGLSATRVHVVPYGVDVDAIPPERPDRPEVRCLAVGRLVAKKAPVLLLDAFRRAAAQQPTLRLDLVGGGALRPAVTQCIQAMDLQGRVTLHGPLSNACVRALMNEADLFLQHSVTDRDGDEEGLPVAILEAMASGLPVISTRHAGIPEAVDDGVTGCLVAEGDSVGMGGAIVDLAGDRETRRAFGRAGRQLATERFSARQERTRLRSIMGLPAGA